MLETTKDSFDFKKLERLLQERLQAQFPQIHSLEIECLLRDQTLVILIHLPDIVTLPTNDILSGLKQIVDAEKTLSSYPIECYLKAQEPHTLKSVFFRLPTKVLWSLGLGLILTLGGYGLSRPCVLGTCSHLTQAQTLAQNAVHTVGLSASTQDILQAKQQLDQSCDLLQEIPFWSKYHTQAQELLNIYQKHSDSLENLAQALNHATKALSLAKPPLSVPQWQKVKQEWQQAIAFLKKLPSDNPYFSYAQLKLRQYQGNVTLIEQQIQTEVQASDRLKAAQQNAQIALIRQNAAQSLADWEFVETTWKSIIKSLQEIPSRTVATAEAQNLIKAYTAQLVNATARKTKEAAATRLYQQAIQQAEIAQKAMKIQQWSSAAIAWRNAITHLQQIPANTFQYTQIQPLIPSYLASLNQAETNLKSAAQLESLRQDLETTCKIPQKICDYQISQAIIKVNLTPSYVQQVWQTAIQAKAQTSIPTQVSLLNHIAKLEKSLQTISNKSQKRVEVYNPEQNIIAIYEPLK